MPDWSTVLSKLTEVSGVLFRRFRTRPVTGGCINGATMLEAEGRRFFVKHNDSSRLEMLKAEAEGLGELAAAKAVRVPSVVCWGADDGVAFLVLEWLELSAAGPRAQSTLGKQLATLHRVTRPQFGWYRDNTIGATPQENSFSDDWVNFFRDHRLGFQFELAARHGFRQFGANGERLLTSLDQFFSDHAPQASLLHGDLWGGNMAETTAGEPVIFDPAVYFGDREADLAMTELFGGFSDSFYRSYNDTWPLASGYETRKHLYNLYHILNHLNLFGRGYLAQAENAVLRLLAEIR